MTNNNLKIEWVVKILLSLVNGHHTGGIQIWFKDGGISSISQPKGKGEQLNIAIATANDIERY